MTLVSSQTEGEAEQDGRMEIGTSGMCLCDLQVVAISTVERSSTALHVLLGMMITIAFMDHVLDTKPCSKTLIIIAPPLLLGSAVSGKDMVSAF